MKWNLVEILDVFCEFSLMSNVGRLEMKDETYLAFDDIMLYILVKKMARYGIKFVKEIV